MLTIVLDRKQLKFSPVLRKQLRGRVGLGRSQVFVEQEYKTVKKG